MRGHIKMYLREVERDGVYSIHLAPDMNTWRALVNTGTFEIHQTGKI